MNSDVSCFVSQEDFKLFHTIDRKLYTLLVINLWRDPAETMQIMALWLWLERIGFRNLIKKMLALPYILVNELADEAVICLNCIRNGLIPSSSSDSNDIHLLKCFVQKEISLQFFNENREKAAEALMKILNDVCLRALADIMQQAIERNNAVTQINPADQTQVDFSASSSIHQPAGTSHQLGIAGSNVVTQSWNANAEYVVPQDDRTMFVTFSKGYPVHEWEVREFFNRTYGNCIESLQMQQVEPNEQSLFARIVFHSASIIDVVLNGMARVKFTINGKHVWMRKFVAKRPKPSLPLQ